jgi:hypothetical protein
VVSQRGTVGYYIQAERIVVGCIAVAGNIVADIGNLTDQKMAVE